MKKQMLQLAAMFGIGFVSCALLQGRITITKQKSREAFEDGVKVGCVVGLQMYKEDFQGDYVGELFKRVRAFPDLPKEYKP